MKKEKLGLLDEQTQLETSNSALFCEIISKLKERGNTVKEAQTRYGHAILTNCLFHTDKTPSMYIFENGGYNCFGCGKKGSNYDIAEVLGIQVERAFKQAGENCKAKAVEYIKRRLVLRSDEDALKAMQLMRIKPYLMKHGNKTIAGVWIDLWNGSWTFRAFEGSTRYLNAPRKGNIPAYGGLLDLLNVNYVVITEGVFDALTVNYFTKIYELSEGEKSPYLAIATQGNMFDAKRVLDFIEQYGVSKVVLAFDNDDEGRKKTQHYVDEALKRGLLIEIVEIPEDFKDINELYMNNIGAFERAFAECLTVFDWYVKQNLDNLNTDEGKRTIYRKFVSFYELSKEKKVTGDQLLEALKKHHLDISEWVKEFEQRHLTWISEQKRKELELDLRRLSEKLRNKQIDTDEVIATLMSKDYKPIRVENLSEISDELLSDDDIRDAFYFSFLGKDVIFFRGDLVLVTAQTKTGKTTLAINMCKSLLDKGKKIIYFTYELTRKQLFRLFVQCYTSKTFDEVTREDKERILEQLDGKLFIFTNSTIREICAYVRAIKPDLFVIDYDESVPINRHFESRERELAYLTLEMKHCAVQNTSICLMLSQINEEGQARYSRSKEHYASIHLHLEKNGESELKCTVKLNRYGKSGDQRFISIDFPRRTITSLIDVREVGDRTCAS